MILFDSMACMALELVILILVSKMTPVRFGFGSSALARARVHVKARTNRNRYYVPCFPVGTKAPYEDRRVVVKVAGEVSILGGTILECFPMSDCYGLQEEAFSISRNEENATCNHRSGVHDSCGNKS